MDFEAADRDFAEAEMDFAPVEIAAAAVEMQVVLEAAVPAVVRGLVSAWPGECGRLVVR